MHVIWSDNETTTGVTHGYLPQDDGAFRANVFGQEILELDVCFGRKSELK